MSRSVRLSYLLILSTSLLLAWFGVKKTIDDSPGNVSGILIVVVALLIFTWIVTSAPQLATSAENQPPSKLARHLEPLIQALLEHPLIYSAVLAGCCAVAVAPYPSFQPWPVLGLWLASIALFLTDVVHLQLAHPTGAIVSRFWAWLRVRRWELLAVLALTVLAFLVRGIAVDAIPHNVHGDEGEMGLAARAVISAKLSDPFATGWLSHPTLWFFLQAAALRLFGDNIGGLRMLSAILGTLAVPALYVFARMLYGRTIAIIATALLAAYHFHVHYSRIGLNNIVDPLFMILTLTAFFYGYRRRSSVGFGLAGIIMGVGQYFYFGERFIPVFVVVLLIYLALTNRRQVYELRRPLGLMLLGFLLAAGPLIRYFITHPDTFSARLVEHGLLQNNNLTKLQTNGQSLLGALADHAYRSFALFVVLPEHSPFYDAAIPLLDSGMAALFLLGVVLILLKWRTFEMMALLLWVVGTAIFGGFLLLDVPQSARYVIATPALCVVVAFAIAEIGALLRELVILPQRVCVGAITAMVLAVMAWNIYFYFEMYTPRNEYAYSQAVTEMAYYISPQARQRYIYGFTMPIYSIHYSTIAFVADQPNGIDVNDHLSSITTLPNSPPGLRPLFIFIPERLDELNIVKQRYPNGQLQEYRIQPAGDRTLMYIYEPAQTN